MCRNIVQFALGAAVAIGALAEASSAQFQFGGFAPHVEYPAGPNPTSIAIGDLNNNGKLDIAVTNRSANAISVLPGAGDGTFGAPVVVAQFDSNVPPWIALPDSITLADFNNDGFLDIAFAGYDAVVVLPNSGKSGLVFGDPLHQFPKWPAERLAAADINGNGIPDLAFTGDSTHGVEFFLGEGDGTFAFHTFIYPIPFTTAIALGDVTGNGLVDIVMPAFSFDSFNAVVVVAFNSGDATFDTMQELPLGTDSATAITVGSAYNVISLPFIAVTSPASWDSSENTVSYFGGDGAGSIGTTPTVLNVGGWPRAITGAALRHHETLDVVPTDLVTANSADDTISVLLRTGSTEFEPQQTFAVGASPRALAVADLNGSGVHDVAVANAAGDSVSVLINLTLDPPVKPCAPADFNCDGAVDVFDLLELLAQWGPCPDPADCPADLDGNGLVDVFDLLALLANWG